MHFYREISSSIKSDLADCVVHTEQVNCVGVCSQNVRGLNRWHGVVII